MNDELEVSFQYEVPKDVTASSLEEKIQEILGESEQDIKQVLLKYNFPSDAATAISGKHQVKVEYEGAGIDPGTIAILIALTPLVKDLVPLAKPVVKNAADVAKRVSLDLWEIVKAKLWEKHHLRLKPKKTKANRDKNKK